MWLLLSQVEWSWRAYDWVGFPATYTRKDLVIAGPVTGITAGQQKVVSLSAKFANGQPTVINVTLTAEASPIEAILRGPSGDVRSDRTIVLSAAGSVDPDDPMNTQPFSIKWDCTREDFPTPCFSGTSVGTQSGLTWSIPGSLLASGVKHTFTATVSKSDGVDTRRDAASVVLRPTTAAIPTGRIQRVCAAAACPLKHSADAPLSLSMVADSGSANAKVAWKSDQVTGINSNDGKWDINVPAALLPTSGSVTVTAVLTMGDLKSETSITVPINGKPVCGKTPCLGVTIGSDTFPGATFSAAPANFQDDDETPLR